MSISSAEREKKPVEVALLDRTFNSYRALTVQGGLFVLLLSVLYGLLSHQPLNYKFLGHPIFNSLGSVFFAQSILITQPAPLSAQQKSWAGQLHGFLNTASVGFFLAGYGVIFYNKYSNNAPHLTTWHALFGITTYIFLVIAMLAGVAQFYFPVVLFGSVAKAKGFYKYHRLSGYFILILTILTTLLSLESSYNVNVLQISYWTVLPACAVFGLGLFAGIDKKRLGL